LALRFAYSTINWGETPDLEKTFGEIREAGWNAVELFWHSLDWLGPMPRLLTALGDLQVATLFGGPMYFAEQLGFRKILDCTFMTAATVREGVDEDDVRKYYKALKRAQDDIDLHHQKYTHYYKQEFPKRFHDLMDTRVFGPGERIVFAPYTQEMYDVTQKWVESWNIFDEGLSGRKNYEASVLT